MPNPSNSALCRGVRAAMPALVGICLAILPMLQGQNLAHADPQPFTRQGDKIVIPEGSALRGRLTIAAATTQSVTRKLSLPAIVEADPARTIALLPPLGGRVLELKVGLGDRVAKGQVLAIIDAPDLAQAYDDNDKAEDAFHLAERDLKRQEEQAKINAISERDLDQARSEFAQAKAEFGRTQAHLRVLEAPLDRGSKVRLLTVKSPVEGSVTTLATAQGAVINDPTQPIMTIADLGVVWVTAMVPELDIALVSKNQDAEVTLAAYPGDVLKGKVSFLSDVLEPDSRRNKVRIAFTNPRHALKPNMFATATLVGPLSQSVQLPTSALLMNNDRVTVFVETAPWTFERRTVDADLQDAAQATIRSGLTGGEKVVVKGGVLLND